MAKADLKKQEFTNETRNHRNYYSYQEFSSFMNEISEKFGPFDPNVQTDEIWHSDYGYGDYDISVDDPDGYIQSIGISYIERGGRYYWISLYKTV